MRDAVIVSTARTAMAKSVRGSFNNTHPIVLAGHVLKHAIARAGVDASEIEDVALGSGMPEGATGFNIARNAAIKAGCPSRPAACRSTATAPRACRRSRSLRIAFAPAKQR